MPRFIVPKNEFTIVQSDGKKERVISKAGFASFNISVLGLGNVSAPSEPIDAVAAVFDLAGFTNFCKQIEPHLSVPYYLDAFLTWLMKELREETLRLEKEDGMRLWCPLPFFVKFLGDGLLVLWNSHEMSDTARRNVIVSMKTICSKYESNFLPTLQTRIVEPPPQLRCGVARGTVFSVGEGEDYVGSCINMAARIQKLPGITFCFNRRGFELEKGNIVKFFTDQIVVKQVIIQGIGEHELVCVLRKEVESLTPKDRKFYKDPSD
jgi:hypothetical protein